jgi:hypothetical protein
MKKFLKPCYNIIITLLALFSIVLVLLDFSSILDLSAQPWEMIIILS